MGPNDFVNLAITLIFVFFFIFLPVVIFYIPYMVHSYMTEISCDEVWLVSFKEFKEEFDTIDWKRSRIFKDSLFSSDKRSQIHEGIFEMKEMGFIMNNFINYRRALRLIKKQFKKNKNR